jgi:hypothetical protein
MTNLPVHPDAPASASPDEPPPPDAARRGRFPARKIEWLLLAINTFFVAIGLAILPSDRDVGLVTTALFGSCLVATAAPLWRRRADARFNARRVEVAGGIPILPRRGLLAVIGTWTMLLGTVLVVFGQNYPTYFLWASAFIAAAGAVLLILVLFRIVPHGLLQFDPEGLTIGERNWRVLLPWTEITEYQTNAALLIDVADFDALVVTPESAREKAMRRLGRNIGWIGTPFMIMPAQYGIPLPALAQAISRYARDKTARAGLRKLLPGP